MRLLATCTSVLLYLGATVAKSSWSFEDAQVSVRGKGVVEDGQGIIKEKLTPNSPLSKQLSLDSSDTLKIVLTTTENKKGKKPHQAFLTLTEQNSGLEESFPFAVKDSGKGKVELTHKELPIQFLTSSKPLHANLVIASFGSSSPYKNLAFQLDVKRDPNVPLQIPEKPVRYGKLEEIHHIFRGDPKSPAKIITLVFTLAVLGAVPLLFGGWLILGANANHVGTALSNAPVSHVLFFGSILAMEGIFFLYYTTWNLFQTLPAVAAVGMVAFFSGSRALSEVQERKLAGKR